MRGKLLVAVAVMLALGVSALAGEAAPPTEEQAPPPKPSPAANYFLNRGKDLLDVFSLKLALGDAGSLLFHARATRLAQLGFGRFVGTKVGFDGPSAGIFGEGRIEYGISIFYWAEIGRKTNPEAITADAVKRNTFFSRVDDIKATGSYREFYDANRPWHTLGAAFSLPFLPGLEASMNPAEAVDFILSWVPIPGFRIPPPYQMMPEPVVGEKVPMPNAVRWHGQEAFEQYD
jgi:hypothetical protein